MRCCKNLTLVHIISLVSLYIVLHTAPESIDDVKWELTILLVSTQTCSGVFFFFLASSH